jgi:hypothetical protein
MGDGFLELFGERKNSHFWAPLETLFPQATLSLSTIVSHQMRDEALPQDRTRRRIILRHRA